MEQAERRRIYSQENVVAAEEAKKGMMRIEGRDSDTRGSLACCSARGRRVRHDSALNLPPRTKTTCQRSAGRGF